MKAQNTEMKNTTPDTLLIIDDDLINRTILREIFKDSYRIEEAENGEDGFRKLAEQKERICALLLDVVMPVMNGLELLEKLAEQEIPEGIPVFLITAEASEQTVKVGYNLGVMDVISKPVVPYVVRRRVDSVVELYRSRRQMRQLVETQQQKLIEKEMQIMNMNVSTIEALATAIEFRSGESGSHVRRISDITRYLLGHTELGRGLRPETVERIANASILHDIGKISIPDAILNKPGKLTKEEFEIMKTHAAIGAELLERIPQLQGQEVFRYAYDIARHHHERWDGKGYPDGLKGDEISIWAQVVALADVYDALVSKRVYKDALGYDEAVQMIARGECGTFNPELIEIFLRVEPELRKLYKRSCEDEEQIS